MGNLQAVEILKEIIGIGEGLSGRLLIFNALTATFRRLNVARDPACPLCGPQATIRDLSAHAA